MKPPKASICIWLIYPHQIHRIKLILLDRSVGENASYKHDLATGAPVSLLMSIPMTHTTTHHPPPYLPG